MNKIFYLPGAAALVALFLVFVKFSEDVSPPNPAICNKESCHKTTEYFLKNVDLTADPCNNFYQYACGGIKKENSGTMVAISVGNNQNLINAIMQPVESKEPKAIKLLKTVFKTCLDKEKISARGAEPLLNDLKSFGGWPVLEGADWKENEFHWETTLGKLSSVMEINFALKLFVYGDEKNSSYNVIIIDQAKQDDPSHYYFLEGLENRVINYYLQLMVDSAIAFGGDSTTAETEMKDAVKLEIEIAKLITPDDQLTDLEKLYNKMSVEELQIRLPGIKWIDFLNLFPFPRQIQKSDHINVKLPKYVEDLIKLFNETPKRTVANFLLWQFVRNFLPLVEVKASYKLSSFLGYNSERVNFCFNQLAKCSTLSKGLTYIRKVYNKKTKPIATGLMDSLRNVLYKNIQKSEWLQPATKTEAKLKLASLTYDIGYPVQAYDDELLDNIFKNVEIHDDYYENSKSSCIANSEIGFGLLNKRAKDNKWLLSISLSSDVNAGYSASDNYITMLPGILSEVLVDPDRPNYVNYGMLGGVVGHEIIHGYDSKGRKYDYEGKLRDWWDAKSAEEFDTRAQCFIDKYNNYTDPITGLKVNGLQTLGENIADSGGFRLAHQAYDYWLETRAAAEEPLLPNLPLNQKQIFWLSVANFFCLKLDEDGRERTIKTDEHSLSDFRIIGAMSNLDEFATDYNCPKESPMNPTKKCTIW